MRAKPNNVKPRLSTKPVHPPLLASHTQLKDLELQLASSNTASPTPVKSVWQLPLSSKNTTHSLAIVMVHLIQCGVAEKSSWQTHTACLAITEMSDEG